jgi:Domain of unknown function (DUF4440)
MIIASLLLCLTAVSPRAGAAPDSTEQLKQLERDRQAAFVRDDIAKLDRETAADYTTINSKGAAADKAQMMSNLNAHKTRVISVTLDDLRARFYGGGSVGIVTGRYHDVHVTSGVRAEADALFTRVFVKADGAWRAVAYQQTAVPPA